MEIKGIRINKLGALESAQENNSDILSVIKECIENSIQHGSTTIGLTIEGRSKDKKSTNQVDQFVEIKRLIITDDGYGMSHDIVLSKFAQAYVRNMDSDSISRNGLGTKTSFSYFNEMTVSTTTDSIITPFTDEYCEDDERDEIMNEISDSFSAYSKLSIGDPDKELRVYKFYTPKSKSRSRIDGFYPCSAFTHGTTIELSDPKHNIVVSVDAIYRLLRHQIPYLRGTGNTFNLTYPKKRGTHTISIEEGMDKDILQVPLLATIIGDSKRGFSFCRYDEKGLPEKVVNIKKEEIYSEPGAYVEVDLRAYLDSTYEGKDLRNTQTVNRRVGDYVELVCGSTIGDGFSESSDATDRINSLVGRFRTSNGSTIASCLRGFIMVQNSKALKLALRDNRKSMDKNDTHVGLYETMVKTFLTKIGSAYTLYNSRMPSMTSEKIHDDLVKTLLRRISTFDSAKRASSTKIGTSTGHINKNKMYKCLDCENVWRAPKEENVSVCPNCASSNIQGFKLSFNNLNIKFTANPIGKTYKLVSFEPYTDEGPQFIFWENHPELIKLRNYVEKGKVKKESGYETALKQKLEIEALKVYSMHTCLIDQGISPDTILEEEARLMKLRFYDNSCFPDPLRRSIWKEYKEINIDVSGILDK